MQQLLRILRAFDAVNSFETLILQKGILSYSRHSEPASFTARE